MIRILQAAIKSRRQSAIGMKDWIIPYTMIHLSLDHRGARVSIQLDTLFHYTMITWITTMISFWIRLQRMKIYRILVLLHSIYCVRWSSYYLIKKTTYVNINSSNVDSLKVPSRRGDTIKSWWNRTSLIWTLRWFCWYQIQQVVTVRFAHRLCWCRT